MHVVLHFHVKVTQTESRCRAVYSELRCTCTKHPETHSMYVYLVKCILCTRTYQNFGFMLINREAQSPAQHIIVMLVLDFSFTA